MTDASGIQHGTGDTAARDVVAGTRLRLLSYNVQVGIATRNAREYLVHSWKHVVPHAHRFDNLDNIAGLIRPYDIVGLQEVDAGSLRSSFVNLTEYLAHRADFPFWHHRVNRRLGKVAQHASGILSRIRPAEITEHRLPGLIPGRGLSMARFGHRDAPMVVINIHLSLSKRARRSQFAFIAELLEDYRHAIVMGDMNCRPDSAELGYLFRHTDLREPLEEFPTFPSWQPLRNIDHILVTPSLDVTRAEVLNHSYSDHLPIAMEVVVPDEVKLTGL